MAAARATAVHAPPTATRAITNASSLGDQVKPCLRNSKWTVKDSAATRPSRTANSNGGLTGPASGRSVQSDVGTATARPSHATVQGLLRITGRFGARSSYSATRTCIPLGNRAGRG
jgi:hypothetical protein